MIDGWCRETEDPASICLSATTTRTWRWNISGQVRLISGPRFCHLGVGESASQKLLTSRNGQVPLLYIINFPPRAGPPVLSPPASCWPSLAPS